MIPIYREQAAADWITSLNQAGPDDVIEERVKSIVTDVRERGDEALQELAARFGDEQPRRIDGGDDLPTKDVQELLQRAAENIERFAKAVAESVKPVRVETSEVITGMEMRPVDRVACYAPGGRHPLPSTVLMTGLSAKAAGVGYISLMCPSAHPAILYAASLVGFDDIYLMGGAQAVAAAAYGTDTVNRVDMIVGPGNAYVTEAKRQLQGVVGIDMLAGPSEVTILADEGADPKLVAVDLLAQAEHDPMARVSLVTWSEALATAVLGELRTLKGEVNLPDFIEESLQNSGLLVYESKQACIDAVNAIAAEHLQIATVNPEKYKSQIRHYGGLFLGYEATVPFGDYMAGPNHTLPTGGTARFSAGLSPLTFLRPQCWMKTNDGFQALAKDTGEFAELEGLHAHAAAARARC